MRYLYFNPFSRQYYFPANFKAFPLFLSFYQSYTFAGWLMWQVWIHFSLFRNFFFTTKTEQLFPLKNLSNYVPTSTVLAFNMGTPGVEQKITILGFVPETNDAFFIKYAESSIARDNVNNEGQVLQQLNHLNFVPKLQNHVNTADYTLIRTNVLKGNRLDRQPEENELFAKLEQLSKQSLKTNKNYLSELETCFAHGDFCPWNMMEHNGQLMLFDWEMAGTYPIGYDLFTFIFQTSMLLTPKISFKKLIQQNETLTNNYFSAFNITNWKPYLIAFASLKLELETKKQNQQLIKSYHKLKLYAEKI